MSSSSILLTISNTYVNGPMAQNVSSPLGTLPTFLTSSLSEAEKAKATTAMHYILGHAHHIATENGYTFQGDIHRIQGSEILVWFKVDFPPTEEFLKMEHYSKMVHLNLRGIIIHSYIMWLMPLSMWLLLYLVKDILNIPALPSPAMYGHINIIYTTLNCLLIRIIIRQTSCIK